MIKGLFSKLVEHPAFNWVNLAWSVLNFGAICLLIFGWSSIKELFSVTGTMGDTLGPLVGLIAAWLVFKTYSDQRQANKFAISAFYINSIIEELKRIEDSIIFIDYKGYKGKESAIYIIKNEIYSKVLKNKNKVWKLDHNFIIYLKELINIIKNLKDTNDRILMFDLDKKTIKILNVKIVHLLELYILYFEKIFTEISNDLNEIQQTEDKYIYTGYEITINSYINIKEQQENYFNYFVEKNMIRTEDQKVLSILELFNYRIDVKKLSNLNLQKKYLVKNQKK